MLLLLQVGSSREGKEQGKGIEKARILILYAIWIRFHSCISALMLSLMMGRDECSTSSLSFWCWPCNSI